MATTNDSVPKKPLVLRIPEGFHKIIQEMPKKQNKLVNNYEKTLLRRAINQEYI
ncbi:MAG: hypothetical protein HRT68_06335 [Flavobacteriaceae bacterium]|nr:hypothetical protein [Flavobacteriaceae bacterium]